ncbi:Tocopherol O-methyltransferase [Thalassoporum mexicanum PCC 7367]|uniref:methyltransferase domain-containing protein n=1 Tax=Thalassoporum mexicanum TaxID=3457544 RepID=UPI00029FD8BB|nr:methyltransferase domain-containing protein [Pseudanabaena sp. PCC 7367]AFY70766.1 Tocopherol O-methyltransferase [Pseudanabaena sp. PCC 7367]
MPTLNRRIQNFYDTSSSLWEKVWGEHMHHGYYATGETNLTKDRRQAQIDLIEEILIWALPKHQLPSLDPAPKILDVGCGIGGSSIYLAQKYSADRAQVTGLTLSPVQAARASQRAIENKVNDRTGFQVADAMAMPFDDHSFDLIWSLESGEHMPDKAEFLRECYRVLKPGGRLIFVTWCHRPTSDRPLSKDEQQHLQRIYDVYCLPYVISLPEYAAIARSLNFQQLKTADWSAQVAPFWDEVIDSAISINSAIGLLQAGLPSIIAALSLRQMARGYERGLVKFGLLTAVK